MSIPALSLGSMRELRDVLFNAMTDGVLIVDQNGVIVDFNPAFHQNLGYDREELIGRAVGTLDPPEFSAKVPERIAAIERDGQATFETAHYRKDGSVMPVELNSRVFEAEGRTLFFSIVRDLTARKKLEADLAHRLEIHDAAINTPALGFWVVDLNGRFVEVNDAYAKMSGYSRAELLDGMTIPDVEAMERPEETAAHIEAVKHDGYARFRTAHKRKDGSVWPAEIVTSASDIQDGLLFVFVEDITEKVAQENRLEQASRVYEAMDQAVVVTDAANRIVSVNPAAERITGYSNDELRGKDPNIFGSGRHDAGFFAAMWESLNATDRWEGEIWDKRKNGEIYAKHLTITVVRDAHGAISQYVSVFSDITARKAAEEDLQRAHDALEDRVAERTRELSCEVASRREAEDELRKLTRAVEQSAHMIFITDLEGTIEYVNPKFTEWLGYAPEEAIGQKASLLKSGDTSEEVYRDLWRAILDGHEWRGELKDRRKDGGVFWASVAIAPVRDDEDRITHFIAAHEDITARKETEAAMQAARRAAEVANKAKTDLLANMSHELRTPLNAIIGFSETMRQAIFGPLSDQYLEYADYIHASGTHLLQLINDILDVSAIEADKLTLRDEVLDVSEICKLSMAILRPRAEDAGVTLRCFDGAGLPRLTADPLRLKQVLINLLSNAVKFTPEGGSVSTDAWIDGDSGEMVVAVADTGIGMDADGIKTAMEKFGQVDGTWARKREGTGLGLPLTRGLVELHGGTMELDSRVGEGTTVTLRFPPERVGAG